MEGNAQMLLTRFIVVKCHVPYWYGSQAAGYSTPLSQIKHTLVTHWLVHSSLLMFVRMCNRKGNRIYLYILRLCYFHSETADNFLWTARAACYATMQENEYDITKFKKIKSIYVFVTVVELFYNWLVTRPGSFLCSTIENWSMNRGIGTRIEGKTQFSFWFANSMWTTKKKHCSQLVSTFSHVICKILRALVFKWFIANQFNYEYFDWFEWTHSLDAWNCLYAIRSEIAFAMHAQMCMQTRRFYSIRCFTSRFHSISTDTRLVGDKKSRHMAPDMQWHCNKWRNRYKSS